MPTFELHCLTPSNTKAVFLYDTERSALTEKCGKVVVPRDPDAALTAPSFCWSKDNPAIKSSTVRRLKISLGLSCNYACSYCSQRFVPGADESQKGKVDAFLEKMPSWFWGGSDGRGEGVTIEFWGGEPLVYWKTLRPLVDGVRTMYPKAKLLMITNGSLLDEEKIEWIDASGLAIGLSHDGPGYHVRGQDPLEDAEKRQAILSLYARLKPTNRISINAMLNRDNQSRASIQQHLQSVFGHDVVIGEGSLIDAYDGDAVSLSLDGPAEHIAYRQKAFGEIRAGQASNFELPGAKIEAFIRSLTSGRPKASLPQKCGIDDPETLIVDLAGNILTCQNVSAAATAPNGASHLCGTVEDIAGARVRSITTWHNRPGCQKCPVIHLCKGSCTFLEGQLFDVSCDHAYSDNVVFLAAAIEYITGCVLLYIEGDFREDRKDIFGQVHGVPETQAKRVIPIQPVAA
jgi:uncharacterized protein